MIYVLKRSTKTYKINCLIVKLRALELARIAWAKLFGQNIV